MKKILAAAFLGAALSLTACGGSDEPGPTKTIFVESTEEAQTDEGTNNSGFTEVEQEFLYDISLYTTPELDAQDPATLVRLGNVICDSFDKGATAREIVEAGGRNGGLSNDSMTTVVASSTVNFCPEHKQSASSS